MASRYLKSACPRDKFRDVCFRTRRHVDRLKCHQRLSSIGTAVGRSKEVETMDSSGDVSIYWVCFGKEISLFDHQPPHAVADKDDGSL